MTDGIQMPTEKSRISIDNIRNEEQDLLIDSETIQEEDEPILAEITDFDAAALVYSPTLERITDDDVALDMDGWDLDTESEEEMSEESEGEGEGEF